MAEWRGFEYEGTSGERCDVAVTLWLRAQAEFAEVSRSRVQALIEQGGVLYDGREAPRGQKNLRPGMRVDVDLDALRALLNPRAPEDIAPLDLPLRLLHLDEHLAVVEKPAGISVHPSPTDDGPALTSVLLHHLGRLSDEGGADRPGIVHRLDKETSGLLVVARDNPTHAALSRQFAERLVEKEYNALVIDPPEVSAGVIDAPIERHPRDRQRMWAGGRGREALTEYRLSALWGPLALLDVALHTGRTHQIRVHLQAVGCAILGDEKYGAGRNGALKAFLKSGSDQSARRAWRLAWPARETRQALLDAITGYPGLFLHARRLAFTHPATGERLEFTLPWPAAWDTVRALCEPCSAE